MDGQVARSAGQLVGLHLLAVQFVGQRHVPRQCGVCGVSLVVQRARFGLERGGVADARQLGLVREVLHGRVVAVVDDGARHLHVEAVDHVHRFRRAARRQGRVHHFGLLVRRRGRGGSGRCRGRARRIALGQRERARHAGDGQRHGEQRDDAGAQTRVLFHDSSPSDAGSGAGSDPSAATGDAASATSDAAGTAGSAAATGAKFACQVVRRITDRKSVV